MKFKIGDKVRIVNYGHLVYGVEDIIDIEKDLIGLTGIVVKTDNIQGIDCYAIQGEVNGSWYYDDQLELQYD